MRGNPGTPSNPSDTSTHLLYTGEQWDIAAQSYYLRARYYDPGIGRFNRADDFSGNNVDPQSLHKYIYTHGNPINGIDPSGRFAIGGIVLGIALSLLMFALSGCSSGGSTSCTCGPDITAQLQGLKTKINSHFATSGYFNNIW